MKTYIYHDVSRRGTVTRVDYVTTNEQGEGRPKYANIYLPYGYEAGEKQRRYNILYLMHGGGGNPDAWLDCCKIKNMLDYCFSVGEAEPFIVVFPSYYKDGAPRVGGPNPPVEQGYTAFFQKELVEDLLPAVESAVNGYAPDCTPEGLKQARAHRGFGGFSMGSCTTWFAFTKNLSYFGTFVPLSGDCWEIQPRGGADVPEQTALALHDAALRSGFAPDAYKIFAATGTKDPAYTGLTPQIEAMKKYTDTFWFSENFAEGNLHYLVKEDGFHAYEEVYDYLYHFLPYLF